MKHRNPITSHLITAARARRALLACCAALLLPSAASAVLRTYHTDTGGGDWVCGSASVGMTGILTTASTYACADDALTYTQNDMFGGPLATWIAGTAVTDDTRIVGQDLYLHTQPGTGWLEFELGYSPDGTGFVALGTALARQQAPGERVVDLSTIEGTIPAGGRLALRVSLLQMFVGTPESLTLGTAVNAAGYIRFSIDEAEPCTAPVENLVQGETTTSSASLSWDPLFATDEYRVYRDGSPTPMAVLTGTTFTDATVAAGVTYTYDVRGYNTARSCESPSSTIDITTPSASANPSPHDFGEILVNASRTETITFTNASAVAIAIDTQAIGGPDASHFRIDGTSCGAFIPSGGSCTTDVVFEPIVEGHKLAVLTLSFTTAGVLPVDVPLEGGVRPQLFVDFDPAGDGAAVSYYAVEMDGLLYFAADDGATGSELWRSDGTPAGTTRVADIRPGAAGSFPGGGFPGDQMVPLDGVLYFTANDGSTGSELWRSDGTAAGTWMVEDLRPAGQSGSPRELAVANGALYFSADDGVNGRELWVTDGSPAGTVMVEPTGTGSANPAQLTACGGSVFYRGNEAASGNELWRTDASPGGTTLVRDILLGTGSGSPNHLTCVNGTLYFAAFEASVGVELWKSDGSELGTQLVRDIFPGTSSGQPENLADLDGTLIFRANDGTNGYEPWRSDPGTSFATRIADIQPGAGSGGMSAPAVVDDLAFFIANDGVRGNGLWRSDGTAAGTAMILDVDPNASDEPSFAISQLRATNGLLFFYVSERALFDPAADLHGLELWESDGSVQGTFLVGELNPGPAVSDTFPLAHFDGRLYFRGIRDDVGNEMWTFDADFPPQVSQIANQAALVNEVVGPLAFTASDDQTLLADLQATATSSNPSVLPNSSGNIDIVRTADGFELLLTPTAEAGGATTVTVEVHDGYRTRRMHFDVEWTRPLIVPTYYPTIQGAIDAASDGDVITIEDGLHVESEIRFFGKKITLRSENGPEHTTIQGQILFLDNENHLSVVEGLTFTNPEGRVMTIWSDWPSGSRPRIRDCVFRGNADGSIHIARGGNPTIIDSRFLYNTSTSWGGGAIYIEAFNDSPGQLTGVSVSGSLFYGNNTATRGGGAINADLYPAGTAVVSISDSVFIGNAAASKGGAIRVRHGDMNGGTVIASIQDNVFESNRSVWGGAIYVSDEGAGGNDVAIRGCWFSNNVGLAGGAISTCGAKIDNSVFIQNRSRGNGGAIEAGETPASGSPPLSADGRCLKPTRVINSTFLDNEAAGEGGALRVWGDFDLANTILWGNRAGDAGDAIWFDRADDPAPDGPFTLRVINLEIENGLEGIHPPTLAPWLVVESQGDHVNFAPLFALEGDVRLLPESPAIDAGKWPLPSPLNIPTVDIDGVYRLTDGDGDGAAMVDIGASEFTSDQPIAALSRPTFTFSVIEGGPLPDSQQLLIRTGGGAELQWTLESRAPWLWLENEDSAGLADTVHGTSIADASSVDLFVDPTGMAHGTYFGRLVLLDSESGAELRTVEVVLHVTTELPVPSDDHLRIQDAIDDAVDGDVVTVADGIYFEQGDRDLDFLGKSITVRSANGPAYTVIDCDDDGVASQAVDFRFGEDSGAILQGFTIRDSSGSAVRVGRSASPTILDSHFLNNTTTGVGAAIYLEGSEATVARSRFEGNSANNTFPWGYGGAIYITGADNTIAESAFIGNAAGYSGGGIAIDFDRNLDLGGERNVISGCRFESNTAANAGGGIYSRGEEISIRGSEFVANSAFAGSGAGAFLTEAWFAGVRPSQVVNSVFHANVGDGLRNSGGKVEVLHGTFVGNSGLGISYPSSGDSSMTIVNSVFTGNGNGSMSGGPADPQHPFFVSHSNLSDWPGGRNWDVSQEEKIFNAPPRFVDEAAGDFRLDPASPNIDAGRDVAALFSDIRGSIRPVEMMDRPVDAGGVPIGYQDSAFDVGAYEFSDFYGGLPGDEPAKAFEELGVKGSLVVTGFEYDVRWKDKDPFPFDERILQAREYGVNLALVDEHGRRIDLAHEDLVVSQQGYGIELVFGPEHIGVWRLRLELASDPDQFALSEEISIEYKEATRYALSEWIVPPEGADPLVRPDVNEEDATYWSVETNRLYAIAPMTTVITWYADTDRTIPIPVVAYITYPDHVLDPTDPDTLIHVADSMPVDLLPGGTPFDLVTKMYADNDANTSENQFTASVEGWAVLLYRDQETTDPEAKERFDVIRTYTWDHASDLGEPLHPTLNPEYPIESLCDAGQCDIGRELGDVDHDLTCGDGWVFFERARYDGHGEGAAYDRSARSGPIFAVNEDDPSTDEDDMVVVWYRRSASSGVCWPSKPLRYDARWPASAKTIVIAGSLGSGALEQDAYGSVENMLIYAQPDRSLPGYNPNEEHAAFFNAAASDRPGVFPLRTDLNRPAADAPAYASGDTSRPYALLKYRDPVDDEWRFEVYRVVVESEAYTVDSGAIVPRDEPLTDACADATYGRHMIDATGALADRPCDLPADVYHLSSNGLLRRRGDGLPGWYNVIGGVVTPVAPDDARRYYVTHSPVLGLVEQGLAADHPEPPPAPAWYLDEHGVLVDPQLYHRLHRPATASQEINPPYPLNQLAFGPCEESYTSSADSLLVDKDSKLFAIHGGYDGRSHEDALAHYFYRLQAGFDLDLDDNGVQDEEVGTCVPWLEGLDGTFESELGQAPAPAAMRYGIVWPDPVPTLFAGETLTGAKTQTGETVGLPNIADQCVVDVLFDGANVEILHPSAKLIDPLAEHAVDFPIPNAEGDPRIAQLLPARGGNNRWVFKALPQHLQDRLTYDELDGDGKLKLRGVFRSGTGEPLMLLDTLSERDIEVVAALAPDLRAPLLELKSIGDAALEGAESLKFAEMKALTAGDAKGPRLDDLATGDKGYYVTVAFNDDLDCPGPVSLNVIRVDCPLYRGQIKVIEPADAFEEKLTLRHNGDFGGHSDERWFQWKSLRATFSGIPNGPDDGSEMWEDYFAVVPVPGSGNEQVLDPVDGGKFYKGAVDVTVQGTGQQLLPDRWFSLRYYHDDAGDGLCGAGFSPWTDPQLYEGWVKRVMKRINLFDQKVTDFHASDVNTLASVIALAGPRKEGDVALSADPDNLRKVGVIEVYDTLLDRARALTIDAGEDQPDYNQAILFAANRLAGLYILLGNEAFADAADPTIGFSTDSGQYGSEAPAVFAFQNQVDSLLEEELTLLRGRESFGQRPFYNRLIWNFTLGDGEVAYRENYAITDQETDQSGDGLPDAPDGTIDERDAMVQYPQGHGDAWGHYLSGIKYYYDLLRHPNYTWQPQTEAILVDQTPVSVDYRDERRFAKAAAARARTGAEVVNLTYRRHYVEDPEGQWQGYKDADTDRAWGVAGWASRAGQGAYLDWVAANAILPPDSPDTVHGIQRVDRKTVLELREIAGRYQEIEARVDEANVGLNPLGIAKHAVPFDIDPGAIANGETHFEQIYGRAVQSLNNAISVFNHANESSQLLRRQQDSLADFQRNVENAEADFQNRLVEVFGYPYPDDCGPGKTYPTSYCQEGPDLYHYMYVDPSEFLGVAPPETFDFPITFVETDVVDAEDEVGGDPLQLLKQREKTVDFHVATDSRFGLIKPEAWQGRRLAPGEIQIARSDLMQARGRFERAVAEYDNLLSHIEQQAELISAQHGLNGDEIDILERAKGRQKSLNQSIMASRAILLGFRTIGRAAVHSSNATAEALPSVLGVIAGLAAGTIIDATAPARAAAMGIGSILNEVMNVAADAQGLVELSIQQAKEITAAQSEIALTAARGGFAVEQQLLVLENLIRSEALLRYEIFNLGEALQQSAGRYRSVLAQGERLVQNRLRFRRQTAARIHEYRYKDMTFRIFRNDALEKYRAQFDMAARYVYLAAKAYDYETTLLDHESMAGQHFLTDIVRQRSIGMIEGGQPLTGSGLADPMRRMWQNFQVLKPQLGFNNPQEETNRFSLRRELFRIAMDEASSDTWRRVLEDHRVEDLWDVPEFRRHCRPFATEGIPQPGLVIPFSTSVTSGMNFFEWPLGGGDSYYSATNFATKVRSSGIWFSNYNSVGLAQTPRVYLVPAGEDVLRSPAAGTGEIRTWRVVDQKLPVPFPIVAAELENTASWIPTVHTLLDELFQIRRHSDFRAYHDSGYVNEAEMSFDSRLVGRSVWNTRWLLIVPGRSLLFDADQGLDTFIHGPPAVGGLGERTGRGISDIKLFFHTYSYSGN